MMKENLLFTLLFSLIIGSFIRTEAQNQHYEIPIIDIKAEIHPGGLVSIRESRTYDYIGSFSWADYRLPKNGFDQITEIQVFEGDQSFINENSEEPGTFSVSETDHQVIIKWHYSATDEQRTFTLFYQLEGAVMIGPEWSEFFWNWLASGREKSTDQLRIQLQLPSAPDSQTLYAWSRTPDDLIDITTSTGVLTFSGLNISRQQSVPIRTLFPSSVFDQSAIRVTAPELRLEDVIEEEAAIQQRRIVKAKRDAWFEEMTPGFTSVLVLLSIALYLLIYSKFGKRHRSMTLSDRETVMIPDRIPPAIIGRLLTGSHTVTHHLTATLFDLSRRGWFQIEEEEREKKWYKSEDSEFIITNPDTPPAEPLTEWEQSLVDFIHSRILLGKSEFSKLFGSGSADRTVAKWYAKWVKQVKSEYKKRGWIDRESYKGVWFNVAVQLIITILSVTLLILGGSGLAIIAIIISTLMMICSVFIIRRTPEGEEIYRRWKAYRDG
ncbi:MAG: DUF2207 domain-containing protein, partial [Balneolaceae bacterium]